MALQTIRNISNLFQYDPERIMKICILISFFMHIIILYSFQRAFPTFWEQSELRTYEVEIIRPPVDDVDLDSHSDTGFEQYEKIDEQEDDYPLQETISLDTKDKRYVSYTIIIKKSIMRHWKYPEKAKEYLIEGKLTALFSLNMNGHMIDIEIVDKSGHEILDREVIRAISNAAPFPAFPDTIKVKKLNILASFDYRLAGG